MSIKEITIGCDVPECRAFCRLASATVLGARAQAAERFGWSRGPDGSDICGPCTRGEEPYR